MWPHHLSGNLLGGIVTGGLVLAVAHIVAPGGVRAFSARTAQPVAAGLILHVQAGATKLTGAWVSKSGEQLEVTHAGPGYRSPGQLVADQEVSVVLGGCHEASGFLEALGQRCSRHVPGTGCLPRPVHIEIERH